MIKIILNSVFALAILASCNKKDCEIATDRANQKYGYMKKAQDAYAQNPTSSNYASLNLRIQEYQQALKSKENECSK